MPVGTVALIGTTNLSVFNQDKTINFTEEDIYGCYSKVIEKYFIAEGVVSKHSVLVGSQDIDPHIIVRNKIYKSMFVLMLHFTG